MVVGLPLALDGGDTDQTRETRAFAERLARRLGDGVPVEMHDERFTTAWPSGRTARRLHGERGLARGRAPAGELARARDRVRVQALVSRRSITSRARTHRRERERDRLERERGVVRPPREAPVDAAADRRSSAPCLSSRPRPSRARRLPRRAPLGRSPRPAAGRRPPSPGRPSLRDVRARRRAAACARTDPQARGPAAPRRRSARRARSPALIALAAVVVAVVAGAARAATAKRSAAARRRRADREGADPGGQDAGADRRRSPRPKGLKGSYRAASRRSPLLNPAHYGAPRARPTSKASCSRPPMTWTPARPSAGSCRSSSWPSRNTSAPAEIARAHALT